MGSDFVYNGAEWVNLAHVRKAILRQDDGAQLVGPAGETLADDQYAFKERIVQIMSASDAWEHLTIGIGPEGEPVIERFPLIGWGLTALGELLPLTAFNADGRGGVVVKMKGDPRVYRLGMTCYPTEEHWFRQVTSQQRKP